ncbi:hypothetical protein X962_5311 [Burkholderia pseudomallei MSHR7343]|nr:hypothetical protein X962_5311 [Burkholderia pseudomallei MSHR7343]
MKGTTVSRAVPHATLSNCNDARWAGPVARSSFRRIAARGRACGRARVEPHVGSAMLELFSNQYSSSRADVRHDARFIATRKAPSCRKPLLSQPTDWSAAD